MLANQPIDYLTGFYSREAFEDFLEKSMCDAEATKGIISLAIVDVDNFKIYNDRYGHDYGDEALKYVTSTLRLTLTEENTYFFRYGGDEFIVVFMGKGANEAYHLVSCYNYNIRRRPFLIKNKLFKITLSAGIASFPRDAKTVKELVKKADEAMYFSKRHGRNRTTISSRMFFLKMGDLMFWSAVFFIVLSFIFAARQFDVIKRTMASVAGKVRLIKLTLRLNSNVDTIVLKEGDSIECRIVGEDDKSVLVEVDKKEGRELVRVEKSKILQITHRTKTSPRK